MPLVALSIATLVSAATFAATVYKWTDERGVVHYSDQPHPEAKEVDVQPAPAISSVPPKATPGQPNADAAPAAALYSNCEIWRPEPDEVFLNTRTMTARIRVEPELRRGHAVALALDGRRLTGLPTTGTEFVISNLERGTHSLLLVIEDGQRKPVCTANAVTFHVRQPSVQAPNPANRPRF